MSTTLELSAIGTHASATVKNKTVVLTGQEKPDGYTGGKRGELLVQGLSLTVNVDKALVVNLDNAGYALFTGLEDISSTEFNQGGPEGYSFTIPTTADSFCTGIYEVTKEGTAEVENTFLVVVAAKMWADPSQNENATIQVKDLVIQENFTGTQAKVYFYFEDGDPTPSKVATGKYSGGD